MRYTLLIIYLVLNFALNAQTRVITGVVKDLQNKEPLAFCSLALLNTTYGSSTNALGTFTIELPSNIITPKLIVAYVGYKTDTLSILESKKEYTIFLKMDEQALNEVVITGVSKATFIRENPVSIVSISTKAIDGAIESNIIDALTKNAAGLSSVKTGPNISKPFIRGLGYNRVLTLYDGIRQEGQQWGDEHGIEIDGYAIAKAEVIKGPSSLMYGSDALAGVVSLLPYIPAEKDSVLKGRFTSEYQSNNGLIGNGLRFGYSAKHITIAINGSFRLAKNYTNPIDGRVFNTGFNEKNISSLIGYINEKGYSHFNFTLYDNLQGIPDGSRDSLSRKFTKQIYEGDLDMIKNRPIVSDNELNSYKLSPLNQHIQHYRIYTNNHYKVGAGEIDATVGVQQNNRKEYNHPTMPQQAGLYIRLNTINYGLRYTAPKIVNTELSIGINGMYQNNKNKAATDFPIPDYTLFDAGAYLHTKWKYKRWTAIGGARIDLRKINSNNFYIKKNIITGFYMQANAADTGTTLQFSKFNKAFNGISLSIGATYQLIENISMKVNISRGYRSPSITELVSNGLDPGAHIIYLGNRNFVPEFSLQEDIGLSANFKNISVTVSVFNNNIANYIYLAQLADSQGNASIDAQGNKTFQYQQASAQLYGIEATMDIHPRFIKGFSFNNAFALVYGYNKKQEYTNKGIYGEYLPFIPPMKLLSSCTQEIKTKSTLLSTLFLKAETEYNATQNRYLALYDSETLTLGYILFNAALGSEIKYAKKQILHFQLQVNNLLDVVYQSNLSRLKYFEYYSESTTQASGIYGMGRNFCVKLILPF